MAASVSYVWDPAKADANKLKHGVEFADVANFDWSSAIVREDDRFDYGETRYIGLGRINSRLHVLIFTASEATVRVVSLRKANSREARSYEKAEAQATGRRHR